MPIQHRPFDPDDPVQRAQWLEWRRADVTASSIGALFGCDPYKTALRLYAEKRGVEFPEADDRVMRRGRWLEPAVGKAVRELRPEWKLELPDVYLRDPELRLGATPDFFIKGDPRGLGVLQAKTCAPSVYFRDWNEGDEPPLWVVLQNSAEVMLTNAAFGAIAVMLVDPAMMDVKIIEVPRNAAAEAKIIGGVKTFWQHVTEAREPDPDFLKDGDVIRALVPRETQGKTVDLSGNNRWPALLAERADLNREIKQREDRVDAIENELRLTMRDAELAVGLMGWRVVFKTSDFKGYSVEPRQSRVLRIYDRRAKQEEAAA